MERPAESRDEIWLMSACVLPAPGADTAVWITLFWTILVILISPIQVHVIGVTSGIAG